MLMQRLPIRVTQTGKMPLSDSQRMKVLISQVHCLVSLILVMPVTNATSERSFSALRRVKTFLRTTMTQLRLNNLFVHSNLTDKINLVELGNEFIRSSEHRQTLFGKFTLTD